MQYVSPGQRDLHVRREGSVLIDLSDRLPATDLIPNLTRCGKGRGADEFETVSAMLQQSNADACDACSDQVVEMKHLFSARTDD